MTALAQQTKPADIDRPKVRCSLCREVVFNGEVVKGRVLRVNAVGCETKCPNCKSWVFVPLSYNPNLCEE